MRSREFISHDDWNKHVNLHTSGDPRVQINEAMISILDSLCA